MVRVLLLVDIHIIIMLVHEKFLDQYREQLELFVDQALAEDLGEGDHKEEVKIRFQF